jgi:phosphoribosylformylglycinamidine synthase
VSRIAVVVFPGTNCHFETAAAVQAAGGHAKLVRWNAPYAEAAGFDAYVIPGGFAYEDRVRAGAIAAKHDVLDAVSEAAESGSPILGVCNGAQILVEAGLVPGVEAGRIEVALAPNATQAWHGYYCEWIHLSTPQTPSFYHIPQDAPVPMPVGHGEGRFSGDPQLFAELERRGQVALRYVRADGSEARGFPANPNGSLFDAAGLCNPAGNVLALMPHPERAAWMYQVPESLPGAWGGRRRAALDAGPGLCGPGPGLALYESLIGAAERAAVGGTCDSTS